MNTSIDKTELNIDDYSKEKNNFDCLKKNNVTFRINASNF